ncbi:MAG: hypothetical protein ACF8R9_09540 [Phycisphaerales bacterium JB054]
MDEIIAEIVGGLTGDDSEARQAARERLRRMTEGGELGAGHATALVRAAVGVEPGEQEWLDPAASVLFAARDVARRDPSPETVAAVREVFAVLRPGARAASLQVLTHIPTVESARAYSELVCTYAGEFDSDGPIGFVARDYGPHFGPPAASAEIAACIFPAVLDATGEAGLRFQMYAMLLEFFEAGLLGREVVASHEGLFVRQLEEALGEVREHQRENVPGRLNWKYEGPYAEVRDLAALMLDLAGWWRTDAVLEAAEAFADVHDPRLRMFRALSLLRAGRAVDPAELEWVAQSPRERYVLHKMLLGMGRVEDLPAACCDRAKLAEGNMVDWLCFGTELGREPDEIELVAAVAVRQGRRFLRRGQLTDYYFFRFRVTEEHWSKERGWMVGMSGGFERAAGVEARPDGATFSHFCGLDEKTMDEHVADYLE